ALRQGGKQPEFHVVPNLALMQTAGVTIQDLVNAIQASNIVDSPGLYEANHQLILGLVGAQVHDADGLRQLVVKSTPAGAPVHVADVATVVQATLPIYTTVTAKGKDAVLLTIARQPSSNTVAVADAVAAKVAELRAKLPAGVKLELFYDQSQLARDSISRVRDAIFIGLILACIILFLFLRDWTSSLVAGLVIPVTIAVTILVLWGIGQSFNLMTLGGLAAAIGLVIDDAIVVVENIVMHRDAGENRSEAVRKALKEITQPLIGSTITPVVVFLPLVSVSGKNTTTGVIVEPMSGVVISFSALRTASDRFSPASRCITMFSTTTMASSITSPMAAARPPSVIRLKLWPMPQSTRMVTAMVTGMTRPATSDDVQSRRKRNRMMQARISPMKMASRTLEIESRTSCDWS